MNFNSFDMQIQCEEFYTQEFLEEEEEEDAWVTQLVE